MKWNYDFILVIDVEIGWLTYVVPLFLRPYIAMYINNYSLRLLQLKLLPTVEIYYITTPFH